MLKVAPQLRHLDDFELFLALERGLAKVFEINGESFILPTVAGGANVKIEYGTDAVGITITLASLASAASRESNTVDNTSNKYLDALVMLKVKTNASAPAGDKAVHVYCWGTADYTATATYPDTVTGADAGITPNNPTQLKYLGSIFTASASTSYQSLLGSIAERFGGTLPAKWGVVVTNATGNALDATGGSFELQYQGIYATVA